MDSSCHNKLDTLKDNGQPLLDGSGQNVGGSINGQNGKDSTEATDGSSNGKQRTWEVREKEFRYVHTILSPRDQLHRCIPFKYINVENIGGDSSEMIVEVLMINSTSGYGLLFPKVGWENDKTVEEAAVREAVEKAGVRGELMGLIRFWWGR